MYFRKIDHFPKKACSESENSYKFIAFQTCNFVFLSFFNSNDTLNLITVPYLSIM